MYYVDVGVAFSLCFLFWYYSHDYENYYYYKLLL